MTCRRIITVSAMFFSLSLFLATASGGRFHDPLEEDYFRYKERGAYVEALDALTRWTTALDDPVLVEVNLFRMEELLRWPELFAGGLEACGLLAAKNATLAKSDALRARLDILRGSLLLRTGKLKQAQEAFGNLGFIRSWRVIGPFANAGFSEFDMARPPSRGEGAALSSVQGKDYPVSWFDAETDVMGMLDFAPRGMDIKEALYYVYADLDIREEGLHTLSLGKTGCVDILINDAAVFRNRDRHGFCFDQYKILLRLSRGRHRLMIKIGDSDAGGIALAVRLTGRGGPAPAGASRDEDPGIPVSASMVSSSYFSALESILKDASPDPARTFLAGYLFHAASLESRETMRGHNFLAQSGKTPGYASWAAYYSALLEEDAGNRERFLREAVRLNPSMLEALEQIARIKLGQDRVYEALPLIDGMRAINPSSPAIKELEARCSLSLGWHQEALRTAQSLIRTGNLSSGKIIQAWVYRLKRQFNSAVREYETLCALDYTNRQWAADLLECYEKCGRNDSMISFLQSRIPFFPADLSFRYKLFSSVRDPDSPARSLPYLLSAMRVSPYDKKALFDLGVLYHSLKQEKLAGFYFERALLMDPGDSGIREYIEFLNGPSDETMPYRMGGDIDAFLKPAEAYRSETAVVLLEEQVIRILSDDSFERRVRRIIRVQDESCIEQFSQFYIVINQSSERLESARCTVMNGEKRVETNETHGMSLSDPEGGIYSDLQARIMVPPSLQKGSIIDLEYRIRSREPETYKGYFGQRIDLGSEYRTMTANLVVSAPSAKRMYIHLRGFDGKSLASTTVKGRKIHRVTLRNISPFNREAGMPDQGTVVPAVYVTSHSDWGSLHGWYTPLWKNRLSVSDEMRKKRAELVSDGDSDLEKTRKIFNFVNGAVRYAGFELGLGGFQPRPADITYKTGMGDCKDIALLLVSLLRDAGIDAQLALVKTRGLGELDLSMPFLGQFNHALCYAGVDGGIFLDGTAKMSGFRELPSDVRDVTAMVMNETGFRFVKTSGGQYHENAEVAQVDVRLDGSGGARLQKSISRSGTLASRERYEMMDVENKKRSISKYWNNEYAGARVTGLKIERIDLDNPVSYSYELEVPNIVNGVDGYLMVRAFLIPSEYYAGYCTVGKRSFPLVIPDRFTGRTSLRYLIPEGYRIFKIPESESMVHKGYEAHFSFTAVDDRHVEVRSTVTFKEFEVPARDYPRFRDFTGFVYRKESEPLILIKKAEDR